MIQRFRSWFRSDIDEDTIHVVRQPSGHAEGRGDKHDIRLKSRRKRFQRPTMRIQLLGVLLLEAKHQLTLF